MGQPTFNVSEQGTSPERYNGAYVPRTHSVWSEPRRSWAADSSRKTISMAQRRSSSSGTASGNRATPARRRPRKDHQDQRPAGDRHRRDAAGHAVPAEYGPVAAARTSDDQSWPEPPARIYQVIARLADGVTIPQARSELATITAQLARDYPQTNEGIVPTVATYNESSTPTQIKLVFWSLMGAVGFVLLIACSNVANLLLARSAERRRKWAFACRSARAAGGSSGNCSLRA